VFQLADVLYLIGDEPALVRLSSHAQRVTPCPPSPPLAISHSRLRAAPDGCDQLDASYTKPRTLLTLLSASSTASDAKSQPPRALGPSSAAATAALLTASTGAKPAASAATSAAARILSPLFGAGAGGSLLPQKRARDPPAASASTHALTPASAAAPGIQRLERWKRMRLSAAAPAPSPDARPQTALTKAWDQRSGWKGLADILTGTCGASHSEHRRSQRL
jgi:hypothetical protein